MSHRHRSPDYLAHTHGAEPDTLALADRVAVRLAREPHVDTTLLTFYSRIRLVSASGGLESMRLWTEDDGEASVRYEPSLGRYVDCPARLTPTDARRLAAVLMAYADSHPSVGEEL